MQLSPDDIEEFKAIYEKEYGVKLTDAEATVQARSLLQLFQAVARAARKSAEHASMDISSRGDFATHSDNESDV